MNDILLRTARPDDLPRIKQIIRQAKTLLKVRRVDQWQDGYPNEEILQDDIARGKGYILQTQGEVHGYFALSFEDEIPYRRIEQGAWLSDGAYCVLHRFALTEKLRGTGAALQVLEFWEQAALAQNIFHSGPTPIPKIFLCNNCLPGADLPTAELFSSGRTRRATRLKKSSATNAGASFYPDKPV